MLREVKDTVTPLEMLDLIMNKVRTIHSPPLMEPPTITIHFGEHEPKTLPADWVSHITVEYTEDY